MIWGPGKSGPDSPTAAGLSITLDARTESTDLALQLQYDDGTDRTSGWVQIEPQRNLRGSCSSADAIVAMAGTSTLARTPPQIQLG